MKARLSQARSAILISKKKKLGLLLLTLTFLQDKHYYKIGGAKPYGFGDCHIKLQTSLNTQAYINAYIDFVKREFGDDPINSQSAKDLLRFSQRMPSDEYLDYMELQEFTKLKMKIKANLANAIVIIGATTPIATPITPKPQNLTATRKGSMLMTAVDLTYSQTSLIIKKSDEPRGSLLILRPKKI